MILDSEEVYQERGKKYRSTAKFMDKKSFIIMVNRLRKQGKEVEQIAIELGASRDDVNRVLKGKY
jgi:predicted transcriptional regulator